MFSVVMVFLVLFDLFLWRWADARLKHLPKAKFWRALSATLILAQLAGLGLMVLPSDVKAILPPAFWRPFSTWLYVWHLLVIPVTLVLMLPVGLWLGIRRLFKRSAPLDPGSIAAADSVHVSSSTPAAPSLMTSRRRFLGATAALAPHIGLAAGLLESDRQAGKFRIREVNLSIPNLPKRLEGMVIAHVSDTHVGRFVRERELEHVIQATADLKPDLVAFTGDLIDYNIADLDMSVAAVKQMERMIKAPVALCVGNHDLFDKPDTFRTRMRIENVGLIMDEVMPVEIRGEKFNLLGLDWGTKGQERADGVSEHMKRLLEKHWNGGFGILLAHHPHAFDQASAAGIPLTLSGHTHGGQIMLTDKIGLGPIAYKYWSGVYEKGNQRLVVSNGVGNWFPIRIGAPAEIAKITLRSA